MPLIPIPAEDLPKRVEKMDESAVYRGIIRAFDVADKLNKSNHKYCTMNVQVIEPLEWKDRSVTDSHIQLPGKFDESGNSIPLNDYEMKREMEAMGQATGLGRLCASAQMKGKFEKEDFLGKEISFMIKNDEYPKGSDNWLPKIAIFLE